MDLEIEQYVVDLRTQIGRGAFGVVYSGVDKASGAAVAAKQINQVLSNEDAAKELQGELLALNKDLKHENIVTIFNHYLKEGYSWIFMELCDVDLDQYTQKNCDQMNSTCQLSIMKQAASGLSFLHLNNVVHRDLKPRNILLKTQDQLPLVKITDLGTAKHLAEDDSMMHTYAGTREFMAPELFQADPEGKLSYRKTVDTFSMGLVFLALEQAKPGKALTPFIEDPTISPKEANAAYVALAMNLRKESGNVYIRPAAIQDTDSLLKQHVKHLINQMTNTEPRFRPSMDVVKNRATLLMDVRTSIIFCKRDINI